jgi:hypothetical protein
MLVVVEHAKACTMLLLVASRMLIASVHLYLCARQYHGSLPLLLHTAPLPLHDSLNMHALSPMHHVLICSGYRRRSVSTDLLCSEREC